MDIGDVRNIYQVNNPGASVVVNSWELKALVQYEYLYGSATWCEPASWDLSGNAYIDESKLNTYRWGQFSYDKDIWD